ncbi:SusC/RagA family TonB-linked outer membrane protein [Flaviaesturariibacter amylovorans]|uniref:TonB-dependent receptor n=1 Tax=Flaviaesturariibacter amylovorans TaxID=1084520 RepID=A0ABP8H114_9BACT
MRRKYLLAALMLPISMQVMAQERRITGRVTGDGNQPLANVSVMVRGASTGTVTNEQGQYSITVPNERAVLVFSFVGFGSREETVGSRGSIDVAMRAAATNNLSEVVVIGYGTASKRDLTGSIAKVSGREVADRPNTNPVASLQGKVAGLQVTPYGTPGKEPDIRIRGTISIGNVKPLYVVDGIFNDNINYLNPNDIESIEILKDPSSLAIFGVRGAGGVIAVTTKRAKAGQTIVNFNSAYGTKKLVDKISVLTSGADFRMLYEEEKANIGATTPFDYSVWNSNTDWIDAVTQTGHFNMNNVSVTASTDRNRFYLGAGYTTDEGIVRHERLEKIMLTFSDEFKVTKNIKLGFNWNGQRQKNPYDGTWALADARRIAPIVSAGTKSYVVDTVRGIRQDIYSTLPTIQNTLGNPLLHLENNWNKYIGRENRMVGSVFAEIGFLQNFTFRAQLYGDMSQVTSNTYNPIYYSYDPSNTSSYPVIKVNRFTRVSQEEARYNKYQQDYILGYKKQLGDHSINATAGWTTYYFGENHLYGNVQQSLTGDPIPDDKRFWNISNGFGDPTTMRSSSYQKENATTSALVRVLYNYKNKYYLNGSFRRDGSSLIYNPDSRYQNFWAVGAAWELTRERFLADNSFFNTLKLKASMGVLGNQNTYGVDYPYFPRIVAGGSAVFGSTIYPAYQRDYQVDPNLKWETVHAKEIGVEFNILRNALHTEINYYHKRTKDLLSYLQNGPNRTLGNFGQIVNQGLEVQSTWNTKITRDLTLAVSGNLTTYKNTVEKFGTFLAAGETTPNQTEVGQPIGYFYGYVVEGVYQSYAEKLKSPKVIGYEYGPGDLKYKDINNDGVIDTKDRTLIGNPTPDFTYGGSVNLAYKGFDLGIDVVGSYGAEVYRIWGSSELPYSRYNYASFKMDRWHGEGTSNWVPILGDNHAINRLPSTFGIEDGSYFRLRNIQLGYNFAPGLISRIRMKAARVYVNVQNLKTWKNNSGYSPEFGGSPTAFGLDNGDGPIPRIITAGINVTF